MTDKTIDTDIGLIKRLQDENRQLEAYLSEACGLIRQLMLWAPALGKAWKAAEKFLERASCLERSKGV